MPFQLSNTVNKDKVFLVKRSEIEGRLDCDYYIPEIVERIRKIQILPHVRLGQRLISLETGKNNKQNTDSGTIFVRTQNIRAIKLDLDSTTYTNDSNVRISQKGDLLFTRIGVGVGDVAFNDFGTFAISDNVILTRFDDNEFSQFCSIFLSTKLGSVFIEREKRDTARAIISYGNVKKIIIPHITNQLRSMIISIIDAAFESKNKKETQALQLLDSIDAYLLNELGIELPPEDQNTICQRMFVRKFSDLSGGRFDSTALQEKVEITRKAIKDGLFNTDKLKHIVKFKADQITEIDGRTYIGLENIQSNTGEYLPSVEKTSISSAGTFKQGDILFPKLRPYLNKVFHASFDGVCSTEFHVLKSLQVEPAFLAIFLRSKAIVNQTTCLMTGNTLPRLQTRDIYNLNIPLPPLKKQIEISSHIQEIRDQFNLLRSEAVAELEKAKLEVEAIILTGENIK